MGAAYLCAEASISTAVIENQAAYVAGWLNKLRDDRKLLIHAAAQAQHAADYIWQKRHSLNFLRRSRTRRFSYSHHEGTLPETKLVPDQNQPATLQ
jgi:antirestriction protein ArdC